MRKKLKVLYDSNLILECSLDLSSEVGSAEKVIEPEPKAKNILPPNQNLKQDNQTQSDPQ